MSIDWSPLADLIETHDRFLVTTHIRPDGDALGSEVGMVGLLRQKGKDVRVVNVSPTPPRYDFLDSNSSLFEHFGTAVNPADLVDRQVAIILDLSAWNQLGDMADFIRRFPGPRAVIDHHVSQDDLGAMFFKDSAAEATGILVMQAIRALGATLTPEVAEGLLTAIAMDTGWLRHSNTRPGTLRAVAELIEAGRKSTKSIESCWNEIHWADCSLMGTTLSAVRVEKEGRIAYSIISRDDLLRTGAIPQDSEDLVNFVASVRGVEVAMLFIEQRRGGVKVSFRARGGLDCSRLAARFGGGGHREAAGASLPDPLAECVAKVVSAVHEALDRG